MLMKDASTIHGSVTRQKDQVLHPLARFELIFLNLDEILDLKSKINLNDTRTLDVTLSSSFNMITKTTVSI